MLLCSGDDADDVWAAHCRDESGLLSQYAAAMYHLATDIWPQSNAETRIEWCYKACMDYFFGGGLKHVREKAARRRGYQLVAADAEALVNETVNNAVQSLNHRSRMRAACDVEAAESAGSSFAMSVTFSFFKLHIGHLQ